MDRNSEFRPSDHGPRGDHQKAKRKRSRRELSRQSSISQQHHGRVEQGGSPPCLDTSGNSPSNIDRKRKLLIGSRCLPNYQDLKNFSSASKCRKRKPVAESVYPPQHVDCTSVSPSGLGNKRQCLGNSEGPSVVDLTGLSSSSERKRRVPLPYEVISISSTSSRSTSSSFHQQEQLKGHSAGADGHTILDQRKAFEEKYFEEQRLGEGGFGTVWAGYTKEGLQPTLDGELQQLPLEVALLKLVGKGNPPPMGIAHLLDWFKLPEEVLLVLERPVPSEDLFDYLAKRSPLEEKDAKVIMKQLLEAAQVIHNRGVVHRDLKPENVLIQPDLMQVHLIDFGCGAILQERPFTNFCGTSIYTAPEWFTERKLHGEPSTVWQLGLILYDMLHFERAFNSSKEVIQKKLMLRNKLSAGLQR
ncbi:hypothetical protein JZ751_026535, partial [Albula glossodonta]